MPRREDRTDLGRTRRPPPPPSPEPPPKPIDPAALVGSLFGPDDEHFERLTDAFRAQAAAADIEELLFVELIVEALGRLRRAHHSEADLPPGETRAHRFRSQATRDFYQAFRELGRLQAERRLREQAEAEVNGPEKPRAIVWVGPEPDVTEPYPRWRQRVVLDPAIDPKWPVVRGTACTAEDVVVDLVDGRLPSEILVDYPGLTPEDIRACVECDRAGKCGPFRPGDPPDAFERDGPLEGRRPHVPMFPLVTDGEPPAG